LWLILQHIINGGIPSENKQADYRETASKKIEYESEEEGIRTFSRGASHNFSRNRVLTFKKLILLIMSLKTSLQRDLDRFFKSVRQSDFNIRAVTKGALSGARSKLNPEAFKRLNTVGVNVFYRDADYYMWGDYRVLAVDDTRLVLPNHPSIKEEFGEHGFGPNADSKRSLAIGSLLYDPLNKVTIDAQIAPYSSSESELLRLHLDYVQAWDLLLPNRGYPGFWLLFFLKARGIEFCIRLKNDWWLKVKDFAESEEKDRSVRFVLSEERSR
jgi:hypothetical protein